MQLCIILNVETQISTKLLKQFLMIKYSIYTLFQKYIQIKQ